MDSSHISAGKDNVIDVAVATDKVDLQVQDSNHIRLSTGGVAPRAMVAPRRTVRPLKSSDGFPFNVLENCFEDWEEEPPADDTAPTPSPGKKRAAVEQEGDAMHENPKKKVQKTGDSSGISLRGISQSNVAVGNTYNYFGTDSIIQHLLQEVNSLRERVRQCEALLRQYGLSVPDVHHNPHQENTESPSRFLSSSGSIGPRFASRFSISSSPTTGGLDQSSSISQSKPFLL